MVLKMFLQRFFFSEYYGLQIETISIFVHFSYWSIKSQPAWPLVRPWVGGGGDVGRAAVRIGDDLTKCPFYCKTLVRENFDHFWTS